MPLVTLNRPRIALCLIFLFVLTALFWQPYQYHTDSEWRDTALSDSPTPPSRPLGWMGENGPPLGIADWPDRLGQMQSPPPSPSTPSTNWPPPPPPPQHHVPDTPLTNNNVTYPRLNSDVLTRERARELLERIQRIRDSVFQPARDEVNKENHWHLDRLVDYLKRAEMRGGYKPPRVVLTSWHWVPCAYGPCTTGEVQWVRPLVDIMKQQEIFYLFTFYENLRRHFNLLGNDLVSHVWADEEQVIWCFADDVNCLQSEENPTGIPPWKLFAFTFWGSRPGDQRWGNPKESFSFNPLGAEWNLVPYQMPDKQFYLGYHYQGCDKLLHVPYEQRKNQIIILAKLSEYFHKWPAYDPKTFYTSLQNYTGYEILSNADVQGGFPIPDGVRSLGLLPPDEYDNQLANAKALLGIGKPPVSPTPFASLCRGVPVIIPYSSKNYEKTCVARPTPDMWCGFDEDVHQHGPAALIGEPYVYTVDKLADKEEILKTIRKAIETPIEPYEPPEMRIEAVKQRLLDYFEVDWEEYAQGKPLSMSNALVSWLENNPDPERH